MFGIKGVRGSWSIAQKDSRLAQQQVNLAVFFREQWHLLQDTACYTASRYDEA